MNITNVEKGLLNAGILRRIRRVERFWKPEEAPPVVAEIRQAQTSEEIAFWNQANRAIMQCYPELHGDSKKALNKYFSLMNEAKVTFK